MTSDDDNLDIKWRKRLYRERLARQTAEKLLEEKSRELYLLNLDLERQVKHRTHELNAALVKAEVAVKVKAEFLANMSHEIRTPMNAIIGLSLLGMNAPIDKQHHYLRNISSASESLLAILNDILDFSKIESGNVKLELEYFNLEEVIENIAMLFTEEVRRKALTFTIIQPSNLNVLLKGDALRLKQILINLINNSAKFTHKGFVNLNVSVISQHEKEIQLQFSVKDSGIGMNEEQQKMLFQSFSQADTSITRRFGGSGLGLVISQKFVEMMGGKITCKSAPDLGSEFFFTLSFEIATSGKGSETSISSPTKKTLLQRLAEAAESLENVRVLLVEDTPLNQQVASEFLRNAKLHVTVADNGKEALALLEHNRFDVILMDVQMPVMDGFEATKIIREHFQFVHLPIIAMSAGVTLDEQEKCHHVGMTDFIAKPINPVQMLEKIKQHLIKQD
jgi:signal transduction histidine kinase/CheY-like chemotaxis protein